MAGLLNPSQAGVQPQDASAAGGQTGASSELQDPILKQIEQNIEAQVPADLKQGYQTIMLAGMKVMFSKETANLMDQQLAASPDVVANVSDGIAKLMVILYQESKGKMSIPAAGLASVSLMCQALDYWEKTGGGQVTEDIVNKATLETTKKTLEKFGIGQDKVQKVIAAGQQAGAAGGAGAPGAPAPGGEQQQHMGV